MGRERVKSRKRFLFVFVFFFVVVVVFFWLLLLLSFCVLRLSFLRYKRRIDERYT